MLFILRETIAAEKRIARDTFASEASLPFFCIYIIVNVRVFYLNRKQSNCVPSTNKLCIVVYYLCACDRLFQSLCMDFNLNCIQKNILIVFL